MSFLVSSQSLSFTASGETSTKSLSMEGLLPDLLVKRLILKIDGDITFPGSGSGLEPEVFDPMFGALNHDSKRLHLAIDGDEYQKLRRHRYQQRFNRAVDDSTVGPHTAAIQHELIIDFDKPGSKWASRPLGGELNEPIKATLALPAGTTGTAFSGSIEVRADQVVAPPDFAPDMVKHIYESQSDFDGKVVKPGDGVQFLLMENRNGGTDWDNVSIKGAYEDMGQDDLDMENQNVQQPLRSEQTLVYTYAPLAVFDGVTVIYDQRNHKTRFEGPLQIRFATRSNSAELPYYTYRAVPVGGA